MDKKHPELFSSRSGKVTRDLSVLNPCCNAKASHIFADLSLTALAAPSTPILFSHLSPTSRESNTTKQSSKLPKGLIAVPCSPVSTKSFYRTFNRFARDLYIDRKDSGERIKSPPLLFDLKGRIIQEQQLRKWAKKGLLFEAEIKMPSSCKDIREALAQCLQESDCVMIQRNKPGDCLREPLLETMPTKCQQLKKGLGECKRGMVDMRKRFRGNQPIAVSKELEGGAQESGHQLYAGKPAFSQTVKTTDGNEPEERDWRELENEKFRKS